jgi:phosphotransferase system  glucose/maltose/N-acetylglucosamine-specific IIC component
MKKLNIMGAFQTFGGAMAVPIAFLPFTGLLLAVTNCPISWAIWPIRTRLFTR